MRERTREDANGCWIWQRALNNAGYGMVWNGGKMRLAHRVAWITYRGAIPAGQCVLHRCDVRACINPDRLFLGTKAENTADMIQKGRAMHPRKVTDEQTNEARRMREAGATYKAIALALGLNYWTAREVASGRKARR